MAGPSRCSEATGVEAAFVVSELVAGYGIPQLTTLCRRDS